MSVARLVLHFATKMEKGCVQCSPRTRALRQVIIYDDLTTVLVNVTRQEDANNKTSMKRTRRSSAKAPHLCLCLSHVHLSITTILVKGTEKPQVKKIKFHNINPKWLDIVSSRS